MKGEGPRNWADLPLELTSSILLRLGSFEILKSAQKVCSSWRRVCKDPYMWRKIDTRNLRNREAMEYDLETMWLHALDLSQGGLLEIYIDSFWSDHLLAHMADRSRNLRRLGLVECGQITNVGIFEAVVKLPLLEELELRHCSMLERHLKAIGQSCPNLKTLKLNCVGYMRLLLDSDSDALAIAETMPGLRHLQLLGNRLTNTGLNAILDSCPHLEHLDLRKCLNVDLVGNLKKRCSESIKDLRRPDDSIADYPSYEYDDFDDQLGEGGYYYEYVPLDDFFIDFFKNA